MAPSPDPYATLEVSPSASDAEVRAAYRRLVQLHHPDHNHGSPESARRFEAVQEAYAAVRRLRQDPGAAARAAATARTGGGGGGAGDPDLDARLAEMERELKAARDARERAVREARRAREQARRAAREAGGDGSEAAGRAQRDRPSDEELGYVSTDDSFSKIIDDAAAELSERWSEARRSPAAHRVSALIDELAAKLTGEPPRRR